MKASSDQELVGRFLKATADLSTYEASEALSGVTQTDVSKWRRGDWKRLTAAKRRVLQQHTPEGHTGWSGNQDMIVKALADDARASYEDARARLIRVRLLESLHAEEWRRYAAGAPTPPAGAPDDQAYEEVLDQALEEDAEERRAREAS